jgi:hypothetical protein
MGNIEPRRILILGGGFAGLTVAMELEKKLALDPGIANVLGINFSGFFAWWLWRTIYLSKLPRFEKKLRVAIDWTLDLIFSKDFVQSLDIRAPMVSHPEESGPSRQSKWQQAELHDTMGAKSTESNPFLTARQHADRQE